MRMYEIHKLHDTMKEKRPSPHLMIIGGCGSSCPEVTRFVYTLGDAQEAKA